MSSCENNILHCLCRRDHPDINGQPSTSPKFIESFHAWNSSGGTNQACIEHYTRLGTPEKCIFAQYVFPFIKSSIFIFQNLYDSWQINNILKIGCSGYNKPMTGCSPAQMSALEKYGASMRTALAPAISRSTVRYACFTVLQVVVGLLPREMCAYRKPCLTASVCCRSGCLPHLASPTARVS